MRTLGLRAEPEAFSWAVSEGSLQVPILVASDRVQAPANFSFAEEVNFLRSRLLQIAKQYLVSEAGLRTPESVPRTTESLRQRLRVEGALLAACCEAGLKTSQGPLATLSSLLGVKSAKKLIESDEYLGLDLTKFKKERREAILVSVSLLKAER